MQILLFVLGFGLFLGLVVIHELGHFIAARRNGVNVKEFGIGFPPRAWARKLHSGLVLSVNWLPLGGFVRLKGEYDSAAGRGTYGAAPFRAKVKIMLAGVAANLVFGLLLLTILAWWGMPKLIGNQFQVARDTKIIRQEVRIESLQPGSPADKAGLKTGDRLVSVSGAEGPIYLKQSSDLPPLGKRYAGQVVQINYEHNGQLRSVETRLRTDQEAGGKAYLGVTPYELQIFRSTWSAPIVALGFTKQLVVLTFAGLGHALAGLGSTIAGLLTGNHLARLNGQDKATEQVAGPVAIVAILWSGGSLGLNYMLMIIVVISLTLALMNALPIPALDGGRLFVSSLFRLMRKPLLRSTENLIHGLGMAVLLILVLLITVVDVRRFF